MPAFCEVALPVPLDRTFTYALRDGDQVSRGARVIAPFRNEKLIGVITATDVAAPTEFEAKYLEAVLDDEPLLSEHLLALAEWIAGYYLAPLGEVLRGMLPLMAEVRRVVYYRITDLGRDVLAGSLDGDGATHNSSSSPKKNKQARIDKQNLEWRVLERLASGEARQSVNAAHGYGRQLTCAGRIASQKMDCPRDCSERDGMRAAPSASPSSSRMRVCHP